MGNAFTKVEIVDPMLDPESNLVVKSKEVRINGLPVRVAYNGLRVENTSNGEVVRVVIELLPDEVIFRRAEPYDNEK